MKKEDRRLCCRILLIIIVAIWIAIFLLCLVEERKLESIRNNDDVIQDEVIVTEEPTEETTKMEERQQQDILKIQQKNWEERNSVKAKYGIVETLGDGVNPQYVDIAEEQLMLIPSEIVYSFISNGWTIYMENANLSKKYFSDEADTVRGIAWIDNKIITIKSSQEAATYSVPHEMGHYFDIIVMGYASDTAEFKRIYAEEVEMLKAQRNIDDTTLLTDSCEFFAETFEYLVRDPSRCTPKARKYVQDCIDEYINSVRGRST